MTEIKSNSSSFDAPAEADLLTQVVNRVGVLTLNRPAARNSLSEALIASLHAALTEERDALRRQFVETDEPGRIAILEEILRLEPVVGALYRRAAQDLEIEHDGETIRIPAGTRNLVPKPGILP